MKHRVRLLALVTALATAVGALALPAQAAGPASFSASSWTWANPLPQGRALYDVASGAGRTVAVGVGGTILTTDGGAWSSASGWTQQNLRSVTYAEDRFVAVGDGGTILTSVDGSTWVKVKSGVSEQLMRVVYGGGRFVAASSGGQILTSADGTTWTAFKAVRGWLSDLAYGGGRFVAVGSNGQALVSTDGQTWTRSDTGQTEDLDAVVYAGDHFVVQTHREGVLTSTDGTAWRTVLKPAIQSLTGTGSLAYGNGVLVAAQWGSLSISTDGGATWVSRSAQHALWGVRFVDDHFVAVGQAGEIVVSKDGKAWQEQSASLAPRLNGVAYGAGRFVAAGGPDILTSTDTQTWTSAYHDPKLNLFGIWYGNGHFTAIGEGEHFPAVLTSTDGRHWAVGSMAESVGLYASGGGVEAAVTDDAYWLSKDGNGWTPSHPLQGRITAITYGNSAFLLTTDKGLVYTAEGLEPKQVGQIAGTVTGLAYGNHTFVAVGAEGFIATSADGAAWQSNARSTIYGLLGVTFADGRFIAVGLGGRILTSTDGRTWTLAHLLTGDLTGAAFGAGRWVTVGNGGEILTAPASFEPACYTQFADVADTYPACRAISTLTTQSIISGYPDGSFRPDQAITRAEFSKLLLTSLGLQPDPLGPITFQDVIGHWAAKGGYLQPLIQRGYIQGFPDGTFRPDATITRAQAVALVVRAAGLTGSRQAPFTDLTGSAWYAGAVSAAYSARLLGRQADTALWDGAVFRGDEPLTRAEAAMLLQNFRSTR